MKVQKTLGAAVLSLGLLVGLSGYAGASSRTISHTGPDSYNKIKTEIKNKVRVNNDNVLKLDNDNWQRAYTGDASVNHNTTGGTAISGDARNTNSLDVSATVDNTGSADAWAGAVGGAGNYGSGSATINHTGPDSYNAVTYKEGTRVNVTNDNYIDIDNNNHQTATSGDAEVHGNTTGGDAVSGDAVNTNSTSVTLNVRN